MLILFCPYESLYHVYRLTKCAKKAMGEITYNGLGKSTYLPQRVPRDHNSPPPTNRCASLTFQYLIYIIIYFIPNLAATGFLDLMNLAKPSSPSRPPGKINGNRRSIGRKTKTGKNLRDLRRKRRREEFCAGRWRCYVDVPGSQSMPSPSRICRPLRTAASGGRSRTLPL